MRQTFFTLPVVDFICYAKQDPMGLVEEISRGAYECGVLSIGDSEKKSWRSNIEALTQALSHINNWSPTTLIGFEFCLPISGRIDCIMAGKNSSGCSNFVHIELKQWSEDNVHNYYTGYTLLVEGGTNRLCSHPCAQVEEYQSHLHNYISAFEKQNVISTGIVYCYNYKLTDKSVLKDDSFVPLLSRVPIFGKGQGEKLAQFLYDTTGHGDGGSILSLIGDCKIYPTKKLQEAAKSMFDNEVLSSQYALIGNQLDAYNSILGSILNTNDSSKTVFIIKGGPGTGKSVIALQLVSALAKNGMQRVFYSTRSKALRDEFGSTIGAVNPQARDLIRNNIDFRPHMYKENDVDVLIVDEAHRIAQSANDQTDRNKEQQTFLSQLTAMLYTARVAVFFIDDNQSVKDGEIGTSDYIRQIALRYLDTIKEEKANYVTAYSKLEGKIAKVQAKLDEAIESGDDKKISEKEKELRSVQREKEVGITVWMEDVNPTVNKVEVIQYELRNQFRCNGSDNYLKWLSNAFSPATERLNDITLDREQYDFEVFDTPQDLYSKIRSLDDYAVLADKICSENPDISYKELKKRTANGHGIKQRARLVAGYCWDWKDKGNQSNGDLLYEVSIPDHNFAMP